MLNFNFIFVPSLQWNEEELVIVSQSWLGFDKEDLIAGIIGLLISYERVRESECLQGELRRK